jgi:5-methylcytosine-specific restriction enzyme subunit McrC
MDTSRSMAVIRVFEYSHLSTGEVFSEKHFEQIVKYNEMHGNKYFNIGNKRVYFKNYVGVLQVGNLNIEILPKADRTEGEAAINKWHNALVYMLHICGYLNIDSISQADLKLQKLTLIDLFYKAFLSEVKTIVHQGIARKYRYNTENRNFLKGRLIFNKHIAQNHLHKEKFYTSAQVYDHDNLLNQILLKALLILKLENKNNHFYSKVCGLLYYFENITEIQPTDSTFENLKFNRNNAKYERAISLARMIIQNYSPDIKTGMNPVIGLLFDMNTLYEKVVFKLLKKHEPEYKPYQLKLSSQCSINFWNNRNIRPDIVGEYSSLADQKAKRFIIDTKWKCPIEGNPTDDDLKQMYSYNIHFGAFSSILLYPESELKIQRSASFNESIAVTQEYKKHSCSTFYIKIFSSDGKINKNAGVEVLDSIIKEKELLSHSTQPHG